jgi:hypothetical protein
LKARARELDELRVECTQLRLQMERSGSATPGTTSAGQAMSADVATELAGLQTECQKLAKKNQRLKEVYSKTVQDYRDALYQLIGYRIDQQGGNKYRLESM